MATPTLKSLRNAFPDARIDLTLLPYVRKIVEQAPWFDDIIEFSPKGEHKGILGRIRYLHALRKNKYDLAVVLPNSFSSAALAFLSGARRRIGYNRQGRGLLLTDRIPAPTRDGEFVPQPMVEYYLKLCEKLGGKTDSTRTQLFVDAESEGRAEKLFDKHGLGNGRPVVALNPGAAYGSSKLWMPKRFAHVGDRLVRNRGCDVVILGGPGEKEIARDIAAAARSNLINLAEEDVGLDLLKSVIKRLNLLITVDSGPRHFAVAFDKPVVTLMGPTDPRYTNSNLERTIVLRAADLDCISCHEKKCPADHECMTRITTDMVFDAAEKLLDRYPG
jgi:heptosyltransferase-2